MLFVDALEGSLKKYNHARMQKSMNLYTKHWQQTLRPFSPRCDSSEFIVKQLCFRTYSWQARKTPSITHEQVSPNQISQFICQHHRIAGSQPGRGWWRSFKSHLTSILESRAAMIHIERTVYHGTSLDQTDVSETFTGRVSPRRVRRMTVHVRYLPYIYQSKLGFSTFSKHKARVPSRRSSMWTISGFEWYHYTLGSRDWTLGSTTLSSGDTFVQ
jgi:hypothetical protein